MNRAYSVLQIKAVKEDDRVIEGIASTPTPDRVGDIIEPMGAKFDLPMPLLWQHNHDEPVGHVEFAKPNTDGIPFKARVFKTDESGSVKEMLDKAWQMVKLGLVRAVSVGFSIEAYEILPKTGGWRINEWNWLELSLVTIPANAEAIITSIKSFDAKAIEACGFKASADSKRDLAKGARCISHGTKTPAGPARAVSLAGSASIQKGSAPMPKMTIAEQIASANEQRTKKLADLNEIMDAADGLTLNDEQKESYKALEEGIKEFDEHIELLKRHEALNRSKVQAVDVIKTQDDASKARSGEGGSSGTRVQVLPKKLPPGTMFTRYVLALARTKGNLALAERHVLGHQQWMSETPELIDIIKTAVDAGTTSNSTWAAPLVNYQIMVSEFLEYLRPRTIIGRIPGLRRVPFKVKIQRQTGGGTVNWVGEGKVKPLTNQTFDTVTLEFAKIAGIVPLTEELVRFSDPSAEALVREDLANSIVAFMDSQFVDPTKASNDVSPASITNGVSADAPTGTSAAALRLDLKTLLTGMYSNNHASGLVWIMTQQQALAISLMVTSLGQPQFPGITPEGGTLLGYPVVASENIPATGGSPTDGYPIIILRAPDILLADDGNVTIDASREASLQMDTAPDSPPTASTNMISLWQHNMIAIKAERYINWGKARTTSVDLIAGARYAE